MTYAVPAITPIGLLVFVLKLGVKPVLSGSQAAYKVAEVEDGNVEPGATVIPFPSAAVFHPANL